MSEQVTLYPAGRQPEAFEGMMLSLAALAADEVPWIAWQVAGRTILILSDRFDRQLRAGDIPVVPPRFTGAVMFSLSMFREAIGSATTGTDEEPGAPWSDSW